MTSKSISLQTNSEVPVTSSTPPSKELSKAQTIVSKALEKPSSSSRRSLEVPGPLDRGARNNLQNLQSVKLLFDPEIPCNVKAIRKKIPRKPDSGYQKLMPEKSIVEASEESDRQLKENLKQQQYNSEQVKVGGETYDIYLDPQSRGRLVMDLNTPKVKNFLLTKMPEGGPRPEDNPREWGNCISNVKTCTSLLGNREQSFCGKDGALVYLVPKTANAIINAAPHDMLSPSETRPGDKMYDSARHAVQGYVHDQEILRIASDLISSFKLEAVDHLNECSVESDDDTDENSKIEQTIDMLEHEHRPTFEKCFYALQVQKSELEMDIESLIRSFKRYPELQQKMGISIKDLHSLHHEVRSYLNHPDVIRRATQRSGVTGWEISEKDKDHVLHPTQRSAEKRIGKFAQPLKDKGLLSSNLEMSGEDELEDVSGFMTQNKEVLFKNILRNSVVNYSLDQTEKLLHQYKDAPHVKKVKQDLSLASSRMPNSFAAVAAGRAKGVPKTEAISELRETLAQKQRLEREILSVEHSVENTYSEIQVHSNQMKVVGFGLKKELLDDVRSPDFLMNYNRHKTELDQVKAALAEKPDQNQTKKLQQKETRLQKLLDEMDPSITTYHLMRKAKRLNMPCFVHYGLSEEYPSLPQTQKIDFSSSSSISQPVSSPSITSPESSLSPISSSSISQPVSAPQITSPESSLSPIPLSSNSRSLSAPLIPT